MWVGDLVRAALALVYPPRCAACDARTDGEELLFCGVCAGALVRLDAADAVAGRIAPWEYGGPLADALLRLKHAGRADLGEPLGRAIAREAAAVIAAARVDVVVPVPLHPARLRARGYNQAALLALGVGEGARLPIELGALERVRDTPPQRGLGPAARRRNVREAFAARGARVAGKRVLLVDDVLTTGATAAACAGALEAAGATRVVVLTAARALP
jgi:ComF family protein